MKKCESIIIILAALLVAACAPSEVPDQTASTETIAPENRVAQELPSKPGSIEDYNQAYFSNGTVCANTIEQIYTLIDQAAADAGVFKNETWIAEKNDVLVLMGESCLQLGWESSIPAGYEETNNLLLETRPYFSDFIETFWEGVRTEDLGALQTARENLVQAADLFAQAGEAIP